ncbi:MAG: hypothetical protein PWQ95_1973 [Thermococcaceae archaeon]|nr:hypothetical protein [Thermococcaceae archaeon]
MNQVQMIFRKASRTLENISPLELLVFNILLTGLLVFPPSGVTLTEYIWGIIKLGIVYGWFVFLITLFSILVDVPNKLDVSIPDWIASIVAFGFITFFLVVERQWSVILKVLILIVVTLLWSCLTIRVLRSLHRKINKGR